MLQESLVDTMEREGKVIDVRCNNASRFGKTKLDAGRPSIAYFTFA